MVDGTAPVEGAAGEVAEDVFGESQAPLFSCGSASKGSASILEDKEDVCPHVVESSLVANTSAGHAVPQVSALVDVDTTSRDEAAAIEAEPKDTANAVVSPDAFAAEGTFRPVSEFHQILSGVDWLNSDVISHKPPDNEAFQALAWMGAAQAEVMFNRIETNWRTIRNPSRFVLGAARRAGYAFS